MPKAFIVVEREHHPDMVIEYPDYATAEANLDSLFIDGICEEDATDAYATALPKRTVLEAVGAHEYVKSPPLGYPEEPAADVAPYFPPKADDPRYVPGVDEHDDALTDEEWTHAYGSPTPEHYARRAKIDARVVETRKRLGI